MLHSPVFLAGVAFLVLLGLVWAFWPNGGAGPASGDAGMPPITRQTLSDDGRNGVTFAATLEGETDGLLVFTVTLDTHTVDLSRYDALQKIRLESGGRTLSAGPGSEYESRDSHHVQVRLLFDAEPGTVTLVAKDLAGVPERRLVFQA